MKLPILVAILLSTAFRSVNAGNIPLRNPFWILNDRKMISSIVSPDRNKPTDVEQYYEQQKIEE